MKQPNLSVAERESLRRALEAKRDELRLHVAQHEEEAQEARVDSPELEDLAEGVIEDRVRGALDELDRRTLAEVERALAKFASGTYGISERTGKPIRLKRLQLLPWARVDTNEADRLVS